MSIDELVAFHESGHAVLVHRLGGEFHSVTIDADETSAGSVLADTSGIGVVERVAVYLGGCLAHRLAQHLPPDVSSAGRSDLLTVYHLIDEHRGYRVERPHQDEIYLAGWDLALHELKTNWATVERVAQTLLKRRSLNRQDLDALL